MDDMREALDEFLAESYENLDRLDRDLVSIEANPGDRAALDAIFRTVHNLKGTCGFFPLPKLGAIAHAGESLLVRLRDGSITWRAEITTALLALVDAVRRDLARIESEGTEVDDDHAALIEDLRRLQDDRATDHPPARRSSSSSPLAEPVDDLRIAPGVARGCIRVDVDLLDRLMDLVGELVLARNQLLRHSVARKDAELARASQRLNQVTSSLQEGVMKARMRPIGTIWDQLPRLVRDLSIDCGKLVQVGLEGRATELDRTIIEAIKDPITHLVRNSVDHGIETPTLRKARGKPEAGRLSLRASHQGGLVLVEIADDGAGIDPGRVAVKALERGLISPEQAERLSDEETIALIFQPGFSTAETITRVSGRGVGLDVVRANIEAIGGTIEVRSSLGRGTTVAIKIPLTLAIIPTLIILDGLGDRYAIPQPSLIELIRLEGPEVARGVEVIGEAAFHRLRGELLPLIDLDHVLGGLRLDPLGCPSLNLVVLQADGRKFGLIVQRIGDTEEIVVKPLGGPIRSIPLFAGATILGDGRVALILDVPGVARSGGVAAAPPVGRKVAEPAWEPDARRSFLMLGLGGGRRLAVPLAEVSRLEEVAASDVERVSDFDVIRHRGRLLPLVRLGASGSTTSAGPIRVVVCDGQGGRAVGLVVDAILDIVEADPPVEPLGRCPGILGSAAFPGLAAELVDVPALIGSFAWGT